MRSGITLTLVGVVLYLGIRQFIDENMALFGLIPSAIGVANLVYAAVLWRRARRITRHLKRLIGPEPRHVSAHTSKTCPSRYECSRAS